MGTGDPCTGHRPRLPASVAAAPGEWDPLSADLRLPPTPAPGSVNLSCVCNLADPVGCKWLLRVPGRLLRPDPPEGSCPLCVTYTWRLALKRHFGHSPLIEFNAPESN